jgi:hypothetical protein
MISRDHAFSPLLPPAAKNQPLHPTVADTAGSCPSPITRYGLVHAVPVIVCGCKTPQPRHLNFGTTCTAKSLPDEIHVALIRHEHSNSDRKTHHRIFIHLTDTSTPSVCTHTTPTQCHLYLLNDGNTTATAATAGDVAETPAGTTGADGFCWR